MDQKEKWIENFTTGKFAQCDKNVITFIANVLFHTTHPEIIEELFGNGYCYYFAKMLKDAFERGKICWHRNYGHIVWMDTDDTAYDIHGPFYDYNDDDLLPAEQALGEMLVDLKHNGKEFNAESPVFHEWAQSFKMTDLCAVAKVYMLMPKTEINDSISVQDNVLPYWRTHKKELSEIFNNTRKEEILNGRK